VLSSKMALEKLVKICHPWETVKTPILIILKVKSFDKCFELHRRINDHKAVS